MTLPGSNRTTCRELHQTARREMMDPVTEPTGRFQAAWQDLEPAARRALELAYESLAGGGLACGAVITDADGHPIAEGRNRAYDPPGGPDALQGTPLAHAEMNAFAAVRTGRDLADCTLLSTQQPCSMCAAAAAFLEVGPVRHLAPDPWALASGQPDPGVSVGSAADLWVVTANLLFLLSIASRAGVDHPTVAGNRQLEPETTGVVLDMAAEGLAAAAWTNGGSLVEVLAARWDRILAAATARTERMGGKSPRPVDQQRRQPMATEKSDLPKLAAPARRALLAAGYTRLEDLTKVKESEVRALHGMGPNAMKTLRQALTERGLSFGG